MDEVNKALWRIMSVATETNYLIPKLLASPYYSYGELLPKEDGVQFYKDNGYWVSPNVIFPVNKLLLAKQAIKKLFNDNSVCSKVYFLFL